VTPAPTVTVRGEAQVEGPPELATVSAVLHTSGASAAEVTRALADLGQQLDRALPDLVFDSVRTDPLSVAPVFDRRSGVRVTGYAGRSATRLTLADFSGLADLLVALSALPGVQLDGPWWSLRHASPLEQQARLAAVRAAVARARDYAAALGATLGDLLELSDTDGGMAGVVPRAFAMAAGAGAPELDLEPQPQTVNAAVLARFSLVGVPAAAAFPL
jgi:uncharacterized protein YggE